MVCAINPSKNVAKQSRQKCASVPPSTREERLPETADIENKIVVTNAASIWRAFVKRWMGYCHGEFYAKPITVFTQ
ncbi:MAG: hypothetical protein JWM16_3598 [Verrucomicrobiales bacterium]|nr:hypothetical protein [Verrucomicrobiales bacterium]